MIMKTKAAWFYCSADSPLSWRGRQFHPHDYLPGAGDFSAILAGSARLYLQAVVIPFTRKKPIFLFSFFKAPPTPFFFFEFS